MKQYSIIITMLILQSCSESDNDNNSVTELEGAWASACIPGFTFFGSPVAQNNEVVTTYQGSNIITVVNTYLDQDCIQLESTIEASQSTLFVSPDEVQVSFTIGNSVISSNGAPVKEIDFLTVNNEIQPNIYLIQNNGNTLYFGLPCSLSPSNCINDRPTEIFYASPYTKVN